MRDSIISHREAWETIQGRWHFIRFLSAVSKLGMFNPPYALWSIWPYLSWMQRSFFLVLFVFSVYCFVVMGRIVIRLRAGSGLPEKRDLFALQRLNANLGQLISAAFYLFGFVLFLDLQSVVPRSSIDGPRPTAVIILQNFIIDFAFDANVFFVFLVLHSAHWFVSQRLRSRLHSSHLEDAFHRS